MSILRTLGKVFGGLIFTVSLGTLILVIALAKFPEYRKQSNPSDLQLQLETLNAQCADKEEVEIKLGEPIGAVNLKCSEIATATSESLPDMVAKAIFDKIYYKEYSCSFLQCLQTLPGDEKFTVITTGHANKFFASIILPLEIASVVGVAIVAVSIRVWYEIAKTLGISCILIGITYFVFPVVEQGVQKFVPPEQSSSILPVISSIFEPMRMNFLIILVIGVLLTIAGFIGAYLQKGQKPKQETKK